MRLDVDEFIDEVFAAIEQRTAIRIEDLTDAEYLELLLDIVARIERREDYKTIIFAEIDRLTK